MKIRLSGLVARDFRVFVVSLAPFRTSVSLWIDITSDRIDYSRVEEEFYFILKKEKEKHATRDRIYKLILK